MSRGLQTFMLSWRNPSAEQGEWNLDTYAARVMAAVDAVREITGCEDVNIIGFCAGGTINTTMLNHLAAQGDDRIHAAAYAVTLLDFGQRTSNPGVLQRGAAVVRARPDPARRRDTR